MDLVVLDGRIDNSQNYDTKSILACPPDFVLRQGVDGRSARVGSTGTDHALRNRNGTRRDHPQLPVRGRGTRIISDDWSETTAGACRGSLTCRTGPAGNKAASPDNRASLRPRPAVLQALQRGCCRSRYRPRPSGNPDRTLRRPGSCRRPDQHRPPARRRFPPAGPVAGIPSATACCPSAWSRSTGSSWSAARPAAPCARIAPHRCRTAVR